MTRRHNLHHGKRGNRRGKGRNLVNQQTANMNQNRSNSRNPNNNPIPKSKSPTPGPSGISATDSQNDDLNTENSIERVKRITNQLSRRLDRSTPSMMFRNSSSNSFQSNSKRTFESLSNNKIETHQERSNSISPEALHYKKKFRAIITGLSDSNSLQI